MCCNWVKGGGGRVPDGGAESLMGLNKHQVKGKDGGLNKHQVKGKDGGLNKHQVKGKDGGLNKHQVKGKDGGLNKHQVKDKDGAVGPRVIWRLVATLSDSFLIPPQHSMCRGGGGGGSSQTSNPPPPHTAKYISYLTCKRVELLRAKEWCTKVLAAIELKNDRYSRLVKEQRC